MQEFERGVMLWRTKRYMLVLGLLATVFSMGCIESGRHEQQSEGQGAFHCRKCI